MPVSDQRKQRREYLKQKAVAISRGVGVGAVGLILGLTTLPLVGAGILCCFLCWVDEDGVTQYGLPVGIGLLIVSVVTGCLAILSGLYAKDHADKAKSLPYVPPVKSSNLPTEKVLLRGARQPVEGQCTTLLRPAEESEDVSAEELLRAAKEPAEKD
jgi:hypothetical protein